MLREEREKIFIGIDIGKKKNWVSVSSLYSKDEIRKRKKYSNSIPGFYKLLAELNRIIEDEEVDIGEVLVGLESTGSYWINIYKFLVVRGFNVVMVKNRLVKLKREAKYSQKGKNDSIDSHCIGLVLKDGDHFCIREINKNYSAIRRMIRSREDFTKIKSQNKNRLREWLDVNNPVYFEVFTTVDSKTGIAILREYPSPRDIVDKDIEEVKEVLRQDSRNKKIDFRLVNEYLVIAKEFYKDTLILDSGDRKEIQCYIRQHESLAEQIKELDKNINEIAHETIPAYDKILKIKGLGEKEVITLLAEIGVVENFPNARTLQAYFGLSIKGESSCTMVKETNITKSGNRLARKCLYHIAMNLVSKNSEWRKLYCYYKAYERKNKNIDKEMLVAVSCKLLRVLYGMLKHNKEFDSIEFFENLNFAKCNKEKFKNEYVDKDGKWNISDEEIDELFAYQYK